ncbi:hypothetical protein [Companilactobacillus nodensis]|uniref:Uncharacterized protein n=1 Tax=Companilactobacillus nodensis DSM 19682 = JCM 14932 = NBRC 107160 TaxID=1423775 RepID=A0A0R1K575_9LACO|nr:hypothetical protein [Companilactobacillus nodensis]KRK78726.1 hypothetical protein FD03_GL002503 [Companilactobacillus nodensis DSM 19682 = JCM 14932 = NBRC 107160]
MANKKIIHQWWFWLFVLIIIGTIGVYYVNNNHTPTNTDNKVAKITKKRPKPVKKSKPVTEKRTPEEEQTFIERAGQAFGQEDSQTIQKYVGSMYSSAYVDGLGMTYTWKTSDAKYIRVDNTDNGITSVYLYDDNAENHLGKNLYQGETIKQMAPRDNYNQ